MGYALACPLRRLWQHPHKILDVFVTPGMTVFEPGPGMGFFTLELARLVGPQGKVVAVDVQPKMLEVLRGRAAKAGLLKQIDLRLVTGEEMGIGDLAGQVDFALAFAMVHELPKPDRFFMEVAGALKTGGKLLFAEPKGHVKGTPFSETLLLAEGAGLKVVSRPVIRSSHAVVLVK